MCICQFIGDTLYRPLVFVTGASGFIGSHMISALLRQNYRVRAGIRDLNKIRHLQNNPDLEFVTIDICDVNSLKSAFDGTDQLFHFAASVDAHLPPEQLRKVNIDGTRNVWNAAGEAGVKKALYCSSTAVYGLLAQNGKRISEEIPPRAVEPYGKSKLEGEYVVQDISAANGMNSVIIRPTAVFGPGENTHFGRELRTAAWSKLLLSGGFENKKFSFVHVHDVAEAAIHVMEHKGNHSNIYNIAVDEPISYEAAFASYLNVLDRAGHDFIKLRILAKLSALAQQMPMLTRWMSSRASKRWAFRIWKPGFDLTYSSRKLLSTSYRFQWYDFEKVIASCIQDPIGIKILCCR